MYRFLFRTVCAARNSPVSVYESCVLSAKCDKVVAPVFGVANRGGVNVLSTSSARFCENKDSVIPSDQDEKANAANESGPTETVQTKVAEQMEEPVVLKADDGSTTQQEVGVKVEQVVEKPTEVKTNAAKSGKESLLDLLGVMKVDVTTKKKLIKLQERQKYQSPTKNQRKPQAMERTVSMFQEATVEASSQSETLDPDLVAAASAAAATLPNSSRVESELLRQLRQRKDITEAQKKGEINNLRTLITDMKVGKNRNQSDELSVNQIRFDEDGRGYTKDKESGGVGRRRTLFSEKRLRIFSPITDKDGVESTVAQPTLWDVDFANELSKFTNLEPVNGFEEMIQWTKEGKLWQYPINNEAGLEDEASVPFHEHIFLDKHLEEGFPRQGPVRHFMELVVAGLSKNPYLTVQQKKEHIFWFRDYFHQKEEVLKEADVYLN